MLVLTGIGGDSVGESLKGRARPSEMSEGEGHAY